MNRNPGIAMIGGCTDTNEFNWLQWKLIARARGASTETVKHAYDTAPRWPVWPPRSVAGAMTNGWVDIKNADVVFVMGGNPAENHPCGFKWTVEAKRTRERQAGGGRSAIHRAPRRWPTSTPSFAPGTDIAFLNGIIRYAIENKRYARRLREDSHQRLVRHLRAATASTTGCSAASTREGDVRQDRLDLRRRREERRLLGRPDAAASPLRLPAPEAARLPLHAGDGGADLRDPQGPVPQGGRGGDLLRSRGDGWAPSSTPWAGRSTRSGCR